MNSNIERTHLLNWIAAFGIFLLCSISGPASAVSTVSLQAINSYIENSGNCSGDIISWNRRHIVKTMSGEMPRAFYYRALGNQEWGPCGQPYLKRILSEFQKAWQIYGLGKVTVAQMEAKEQELTKLMFSALSAGSEGVKLIEDYENDISWKLLNLVPDRQYFNCTYFGNQPRCED